MPTRSLIGAPKAAVDTPALLVDLDVMESNIGRVVEYPRHSCLHNYRGDTSSTPRGYVLAALVRTGAASAPDQPDGNQASSVCR